MGRGKVLIVAAALAAAFVCSVCFPPVAGGRPADSPSAVINEIFYDPQGSDAGQEFVELFNRSEQAVCLLGWTLETGNGAYEQRWKLEWQGIETDTISPGGFFVISEESVDPEGDYVTNLDLQNGPDGCRLTSLDGSVDVVGWGDLLYAEYYEGEPCEKAASGSSIGRDPDGLDTGHNQEDFAPFERPSPHDYNHPPSDLKIAKAALSRYTTTSGVDIDIVCCVANCGTQACGTGGTVFAAVGAHEDSTRLTGDLTPGDLFDVVVRPVSPGEGLHLVRVWHRSAFDRWHDNDSLVTTIVLPPSPVVVNEIMFRPGSHDCEWIELLNTGYTAIDLKSWTLEDQCRRPRTITEDDLWLEAGAYLLLVEDQQVFAMAHQDPDINFLRPAGGWPTLNDKDGAFGIADMVVVRDYHGTAVDSVAYRERWSSPGVSIERIDPRQPSPNPANWSPHYGGDQSSPGRANSVSFHVGDGRDILSLCPEAFTPDGNGANDFLAVKVTFPEACLVRLGVFDLAGNMVQSLIDGEVIEQSRTTFWNGKSTDGRDLATGVYLVTLEAKATSSDRAYELKRPAILVRR
jgi:hypothetical protein